MKSWADEQDDSSDDDDDSPIFPPSGNDKISHTNVAKAVDERENNYQIPQKEFMLPTQPPYTAYVGNLSYDIRGSNDLRREVEALLSQRQCTLARRLTDARLMMEKGSNASRGYGYVEFETDGEVRFLTKDDDTTLDFLSCACSEKNHAASPSLLYRTPES